MNKQLPILYTFIRCPWAMRARLSLNYMNIPFETREVDLKNKPQSLLHYSPKATVPVLILPDGKILEESLDIILYAMPDPNPVYADAIKELIRINDTDFKINLNGYKYPDRRENTLSREEYQNNCLIFLNLLESKLNINHYLFDATVSIADIAIFPLVRQFSIVDLKWFVDAPYPNIRRWIELISSSDYFNKTMQKHPIWIDK